MLILVLNCGSSSIKFATFEVAAHGEPSELVRGTLDLTHELPELTSTLSEPAVLPAPGASDLVPALESLLDWLVGRGALPPSGPDVVAHRVVHGGDAFNRGVRIDEEVRRRIEELTELAPLHNRPALSAIEIVSRHFPAVPQTASFDTAFHRTMPLRASRYAIPFELAERHGLQRYGFHGLAHAAMARRATALLELDPATARLITLQLGAGCSATAIEGGRSVDTTMGLTPLEGLVMATRSGDVDPTLAHRLAEAEGVTLDEAESILNRRSGLLGVSGISGDLRVLVSAAESGNEAAALAIEMFCYRVRKQVGAYLAALGGAEAVVFGGGIGQHQPEVRARILGGLEALGIRIDASRNAAAHGDAVVSAPGSSVAACVIEVDEEWLMAQEALIALGL